MAYSPAEIARPTEAPIRVFVVERQVLLAKAICQLFDQDAAFAAAGDAPELDAHALRDAKPDLVVLDIDHDLGAMRESFKAIRECVPTARVCMLSAHLSSELMLRALSAGADGYLVKDITPSEFLASVKAMARGGFYADQRLSGMLLRRHALRRGHNREELSARELDVVRLIAQGLSNKEIGDRLMISDKTIKNHISSIFSKLHLAARTQVAVYAIHNGLV
ncbi:MAG: LuxR C-terminal-related transcriptional regulator [Vulcanimicrobiaceae bacterium]